MPTFILLAHRASTAPAFSLDDLPGSGGRMDIVCRVVTSALLHSHGVRSDVEVIALLQGPPGAPVAVRFDGAKVRRLNPDERSTAALVRRALATPRTGPVWREASPGVSVADATLADLLDTLATRPLVLLDEGGDDARAAPPPADAVYVIGDDQGFTPEEDAEVRGRGARAVSLGPRSLQADQAVVVLLNELDRAGAR
ncbi:MAG TPA: tRNA (pseudouridine(54)-N(1))-methyltransferase TrmY [Candidatus Thermoplasmatota archaeon]|nr:tRNA (pseudouridine(54)-N(1))-methyltransferase TrmY [Candidatus Thermoplasmatota archaeon]